MRTRGSIGAQLRIDAPPSIARPGVGGWCRCRCGGRGCRRRGGGTRRRRNHDRSRRRAGRRVVGSLPGEARPRARDRNHCDSEADVELRASPVCHGRGPRHRTTVNASSTSFRTFAERGSAAPRPRMACETARSGFSARTRSAASPGWPAREGGNRHAPTARTTAATARRRPRSCSGEHPRRVGQHGHPPHRPAARNLGAHAHHPRERHVHDARQRDAELGDVRGHRGEPHRPDERPRLHEPAVDDQPALARVLRAAHLARASGARAGTTRRAGRTAAQSSARGHAPRRRARSRTRSTSRAPRRGAASSRRRGTGGRASASTSTRTRTGRAAGRRAACRQPST